MPFGVYPFGAALKETQGEPAPFSETHPMTPSKECLFFEAQHAQGPSHGKWRPGKAVPQPCSQGWAIQTLVELTS